MPSSTFIAAFFLALSLGTCSGQRVPRRYQCKKPVKFEEIVATVQSKDGVNASSEFTKNKADWSIHGLWAYKEGEFSYKYCCSLESFNATQLSHIRDDLEVRRSLSLNRSGQKLSEARMLKLTSPRRLTGTATEATIQGSGTTSGENMEPVRSKSNTASSLITSRRPWNHSKSWTRKTWWKGGELRQRFCYHANTLTPKSCKSSFKSCFDRDRQLVKQPLLYSGMTNRKHIESRDS